MTRISKDNMTLTDLLVSAATEYPGHGIGFVRPDRSVLFNTYPELLTRARRYLAGLQQMGFVPGDQVILSMAENQETIQIFWGCLLGGIVPTILQPPISLTGHNPAAHKMENVYKVLNRCPVILSPGLAREFHSKIIDNQHIITNDLIPVVPKEGNLHRGSENDIAFIQFSSGSTGDPKGIMLTHRNIMTNLRAIGEGLDFNFSDRTVSWMPLYHDMGLVGYHLAPLFGKYDQYLIEPVDFIKRPSLWLDTMDRVHCTITGCPNFGQALLMRSIKNKESGMWDMSSVKAVTNGAEPISVKVMTEFIEMMAPYKFRKEAMMPVYGMAEATLAVTFSDLHRGPVITAFNRKILQKENRAVKINACNANSIELVSVGKALKNVEIRLVDAQGREVDDSIVGQIEIRGGGVTSGYVNNREATAASFREGWLKTGDNGFCFEGNLYITGRSKDIIFLRGQNLYAHDLENLAIQFPEIAYGKIVIAGVFDENKGRDIIVLFLAGIHDTELMTTFLKLKVFYRSTYGVTIDRFIPIRSNQIPRTSSGKIQRYRLVERYQNGEFDAVIEEVAKLMKE